MTRAGSIDVLRAALDAALDPVVVLMAVRDEHDAIVDLEYAEANAEACRLNRLPHEQLIGRRLLSLLPGHRDGGLFDLYCGVIESGRALELTDFALDVHGLEDTIRRIDVRARKVGDGLSVTWRDVTDRHLAEQQLSRSEAARRHTLEGVLDSQVILESVRSVDRQVTDFVYVDLNASAAADLGVDASDVIRGLLLDRHPGIAGSAMWTDLLTALERGEPVARHNVSLAACGLAPERLFDVLVTPRGDVVSIAWRDVTEREETQARLAEAEERYRLLSANALDIVYETDMSGAIVWVSPSVTPLLGWRPDELVGRSVLDLVHPEDRAVADEAGTVVKAAIEGPRLVIRYLRADGGFTWMSGVATNRRDADGDLTGVVVSLRVVDDVVEAREQAEEGEAVLVSILESMLDAHALLRVTVDEATGTVDFVVEGINPVAAAHTGYAAADLVGRTLSQTLPPSTIASLLARLRDVVTTGVPIVDTAVPFIDVPHAPTQLFDVSAVRLGDRISLTWRDVTEREAAREQLAASERRFRLLADHGSDVVIQLGPDARFLWVSPSARTALGWDAGVLVGRLSSEFIHPDDVAAVQAAVESSDLSGHEARVRYRWRTPEGPYVWVDASGSPYIEPDGRAGRVVRLRNIEREVRAEQELARREEQYRLLAENSSDVVYRTDADGAITWVSPSVHALLGWAPEELVGRSAVDVVFEEDQHRVRELRPRMYGGEGVTGLVVRIRVATGETRWVSLTTRPVRDRRGAPDGLVVSVREVDELVHATQEAKSAARRLQANSDAMLDPQLLLTAVRGPESDIVGFVIVDVNRAAADYVGRSVHDLEGLTLAELSPAASASGLPALLAATVETGRPTILSDWEHRSSRHGEDRRFDIVATRVGDGVSMTWRDVTERAHAAQALAESEERFRLVAENVTDVLVHVREGRIAWTSPSVTDLLGGSPEDWIGQRIADLIHPDDRDQMLQVTDALRDGGAVLRRVRVRDRSGEYRWIESHTKPYLDSAGRADGAISNLRGVDAQVRAEHALEQLAHWDQLTGLLNRGEGLRRLDRRLTSGRRPGDAIAVAFCDLDDFKRVNDEHGHAAGDLLLETVAQRVRRTVREEDLVARLGGDELLVVLDGVHDVGEAAAIAEKVRASVAEPVPFGTHLLGATVSIGVVLAGSGESLDSVIARADVAMYEAKNSGRDQVVYVR